MLRFGLVLIVVAGVCAGAQAVVVDCVTVGNPDNAGELAGVGAGGYGPNRICGGVAYTYNIGTFEVTAGQYCEFLNKVAATDTHGLYHSSMWSEDAGCKIERLGTPGNYSYAVAAAFAARPVNYVSWFDCLRFANWMHNGQPVGAQDASTTENGSYDMGQDLTALESPIRNPGATWVLPTEDEWYKAAYYDPDRPGGAGYWDYATRSDTPPSADCANFDSNAPVDVGSYSCPSTYGTYDQNGNIYEWVENWVDTQKPNERGQWGGSWFEDARILPASHRIGEAGNMEYDFQGFRVAMVPEPATLALVVAGGLASIRRRR